LRHDLDYQIDNLRPFLPPPRCLRPVECLFWLYPKKHVRQKDNVRSYLGYGAIDRDIVLSCAADRATLWGMGNLNRDQGHIYSVPLPAALSGKAQLHEFYATVAWFTPPRIGAAKYRGARLKLLEPPDLNALGVGASKHRNCPGWIAILFGAVGLMRSGL
jgi:hypothetical protein